MQLKKIKSYMMPISMAIGIIFYLPLSRLAFTTQYMIFFMLLISYSNISLKEVRIKKYHIYLLLIQLFGSIIIYLLFHWFSPVIAQGAMICVLAPTATSAVVITGMLGGNTASLTAYSLLSNFTVALAAPVFFSLISTNAEISFLEEFLQIGKSVGILLILPFIISVLIDKLSPKLHEKIKAAQSFSFILWNSALMIVTARTVLFLIIEGSSHVVTAYMLFLLILVICIFQFLIGRYIGRRFNDTIAGGQGLGQKNTVLSIWMAQTYLDPISSIGPGAYVLWQNIINSYQVWRKRNRN